MNTTRASTNDFSPAFRQNDAADWANAGRAWRCRVSAGGAGVPAEVRIGRTALVNSVLGAIKRFDCDLCDHADVAATLHEAVQRFNQRVA